MGQYWKILNIDKREKLANKSGLKLWEIVHNDTAQQLVPLLARPTLLQCNELLNQYRAGAAHSALPHGGLTGNMGRFGKLPNELFTLLTGFLADRDAIFLGLTCRAVWWRMQNRLQEALFAYVAPWSGHRIVTLGDYAVGHPPDLLTEAEETELRWNHFGDEGHDGEVADNEDQHLPPTSLYDHASDNYAEVKPNLLHVVVGSCLDPPDVVLLQALTKPLYDWVEDEDGYVLRNLSKHQYVRGNALVQLCGGRAKAQQPFIQPVGFGELIAMRTQWTDDPSGTMGYMKGHWAGDRFDIVLMKTLEQKVEGEGWKDVSGDAVDLLDKTMDYKLRGFLGQ